MKNLSQHSIIHSKMNIPMSMPKTQTKSTQSQATHRWRLLLLGAQCQLTTMHLLCLSLWFCSSSARLLSRVKLLQLFSTKVQEPAHSQRGWMGSGPWLRHRHLRPFNTQLSCTQTPFFFSWISILHSPSTVNCSEVFSISWKFDQKIVNDG